MRIKSLHPRQSFFDASTKEYPLQSPKDAIIPMERILTEHSNDKDSSFISMFELRRAVIISAYTHFETTIQRSLFHEPIEKL